MKRMNTILLAAWMLGSAGLAFGPGAARGDEPPPAAGRPAQGAVPVADVDAALARAAAFLLTRQGPDGAWMQNPAVTGFDCWALAVSPGRETPEVQAALRRGLEYITARAQPDGSIYNPEQDEYPTYSTAICTIVLAQFNRPQDEKILRAARAFLMKTQFTDAANDGVFYGGAGYGGGKSKRADLSNTQWALEAMYMTDRLDREPAANDPEKARQSDLAWDRAIKFLEQCQNLKDVNKQTWVTDDPDSRGGFAYKPGESLPGEKGGGSHRTYGSMTYAGLKSLIYAKLTKDDPRVKAATEWVARHYTFEENPGMKDSGLYYYFHTAAKTLAVLGQEELTLPDGSKRRWREDLTRAVLARQNADGSWSNRNNRFWEGVPELSTGFSAMCLGVTLDRQPQAPQP